MRRVGIICLFMAMALPMAWSVVPTDKQFVVVIDAGHGGNDPGAVGHSCFEKDLNLLVALKAGKKIQELYPFVDVRYTRESDYFIPLQKRADFVNKNNADLFICIHTNASQSSVAKGAETFILGTEKLDRNLDVAMRENSVIMLEKDYQTTYQGFNPSSIDSYIMFELMQNQYMDLSLLFASSLQQRFAGTLHRGDRGVRQAAFWVLLKSACPSVLVEMGFISNTEEEQYLCSEKGQNEMADAISAAFGEYYLRQSNPKVTIDVNASYYAVQILASHTMLSDTDSRLKGIQGCYCLKVGDWYKYYIGREPTRERALNIREQYLSLFPGCFVVQIKE